MNSVQTARVAKAQWFLGTATAFMAQLEKELIAFEKRCRRLGVKPAVRLNGTSDILWERKVVGYQGRLIPKFPDIQFYDYTKIPSRMYADDIPANYDLTYSRGEETPDILVHSIVPEGRNVAVVFKGPELPSEYLGYPVINGDLHDLRFTDPKGVIVGLIAKGPAKNDTSGFVVDAVNIELR